MEAGLVVFGLGAIAVIAAIATPFALQGRWLTAAAIAVPALALVFWLQWSAWRQKHDGRN